MKTLLWLDDIRNPFIGIWLDQWAPEYKDASTSKIKWVKNYTEFSEWITENGLPDEIGFDHDLGKEEVDFFDEVKCERDDKSGMDCAKWLVEYCMDNDLDIPDYFVQSANPTGRENIKSLLDNYNKFRKS